MTLEYSHRCTPARDRRFRKWEKVVLDSFACNCEDHLVTRRDGSDTTT